AQARRAQERRAQELRTLSPRRGATGSRARARAPAPPRRARAHAGKRGRRARTNRGAEILTGVCRKWEKTGTLQAMVAFVSALSLLLGSLHGTVMRGPTMPVCQVGKPCDAPAAHVTLFFTRY